MTANGPATGSGTRPPPTCCSPRDTAVWEAEDFALTPTRTFKLFSIEKFCSSLLLQAPDTSGLWTLLSPIFAR